MNTIGNDIQVCCYLGKWPNHEEVDSWFVSTKENALESVRQDTIRNCETFNYRIVDWMNRFTPIFFEHKKTD